MSQKYLQPIKMSHADAVFINSLSCSLKSKIFYTDFYSYMYWPLAHFVSPEWQECIIPGKGRVGNESRAAKAKYLNCVIASLFLT